MKIAAISDLHGDFEPVLKVLELEKPDLLLCAGDWGAADEISEDDFLPIVQNVFTLTIFGNNDYLDLLPAIKNKDRTPILLENGQVRQFENLKIAGISGIWAKSHTKPWYITDEEVVEAAQKLSGQNLDILITHGCPIGMADLTPEGKHGGQRCFTQAFKIVQPKLHLCGHLHRKSSYQTKDGRLVVNIGFTKLGDYALFYPENGNFKFENKII
jgi:Icc-related predicted phosphoesterase